MSRVPEVNQACDVCGDDTWPASKLKPIGDGKMACPYDYRGMHDAEMRQLPPRQIIRSPKARKEVRTSEPTELYAKSEGAVFNLLTADYNGGVVPYRYVDVTSGDGAVIGTPSVRAAGWACLYLYGVINEDRRPENWTVRAKAKLREYADFLLTYQAGSDTQDADLVTLIGATTSTQLEYGGFLTVEPAPRTYLLATVYSEDQGTCGLALLRAWQVLGEEKYRTGYRRAITCLRRMQQGGKLVTKYAVPASGSTGRYHSGMWAHKMEIRDPAGVGGGLGEAGAIVGMTLLVKTSPAPGLISASDVFNHCTWPIDFDALPPGNTIVVRLAVRCKQAILGQTTTYFLRHGPVATCAPDTDPNDGTVIGSVTLGPTELLRETLIAGSIARPSGIHWLYISGTSTDPGGTTIQGGLISISVVP